ncbi:MAG: hypothetical protein U1E51_21850 [Candidatus Binatia bacterium]|nr:hypothetical protein [Candidatus Binatia bacterium]
MSASAADLDLMLAASHAPTMGNVAKVNYSHLDMIDYLLAHPGASLKDLAARYGYSIGWICNVQASDAWKSAYAARRAELVDPVLAATIAERFEGVTALSLQRLQEKLEAPQVSDQVVLRAVELGARAIGIGGNAPPPAPSQDHLARLAERLIELQSNVRQKGVLINGESHEVPEGA